VSPQLLKQRTSENKMKNIVYLSHSDYQTVMNSCSENIGTSKLIETIKIIRASNLNDPPPSLRATKFTVEMYSDALSKGENPDPQNHHNPEVFEIRVFNPIKAITVNMGNGDIVMDLNEMSLKFIEGLGKGENIQSIAKLIELYNLIKNWEDSL